MDRRQERGDRGADLCRDGLILIFVMRLSECRQHMARETKYTEKRTLWVNLVTPGQWARGQLQITQLVDDSLATLGEAGAERNRLETTSYKFWLSLCDKQNVL